jgi:hypothetical protein
MDKMDETPYYTLDYVLKINKEMDELDRCINYKPFTKCKYCNQFGKFLENKVDTTQCYNSKFMEMKK